MINKYEPFKWEEKIDDNQLGIENTLYQYNVLGLGMINISGFKEERYSYLIGKLLSYKNGFEGHNISDPDIIELIEISKDQKIIHKLVLHMWQQNNPPIIATPHFFGPIFILNHSNLCGNRSLHQLFGPKKWVLYYHICCSIFRNILFSKEK